MSYGVCKAFGDQVPDGGDEALVANPECVCPTAMAAMLCATGHMLECHYPMTCREAECDHYKRALEAEGYTDIDCLTDPPEPIEPGDVP
jgi:hypothetical protein